MPRTSSKSSPPLLIIQQVSSSLRPAIMSMSYAANKLRVPPGFEHLLEGLSREILREQPKNLVEFAAQYFRKKLQERDGKCKDHVRY